MPDSFIHPLAVHEHAGQLHPLLWVRVHEKSRIVTDLLGHDERSYDSPAHRELISRAGRWLTTRTDGGRPTSPCAGEVMSCAYAPVWGHG